MPAVGRPWPSDDYGVGDGDKDDDGDHLNFTPPPKVFEKLHETKLKAWKIFKEIIIDARIIKCSVHYLIGHLSTYILCVQIPSPIFSDIPEDLFTTLSHLR